MRIVLLTLCLTATLAGQKMHHGKHQPEPHHRRSAQEWVDILERPERDDWQMPAEVVAALGLEPGQDVADIGAGSGYFSVPFAKEVGPEGTVYAVDVQKDLIDHLAERAKSDNVPNLEPVLGKFDDPLLADSSVDLVFLCDVVHHIQDRETYWPKVAQAMRSDGRIAIVDFHKKDQPVGPSKAMKIAKDDMVGELEQAGFRLVEEHEFLPYQYFLVFAR